MTNQQEEMKSENFVFHITRKPNCILHVEIDATPEVVKSARQKAIKSVNKEISIPGFRKGKAPETIVLQQFESYVSKDWSNELINMAFVDFMKTSKFYPYNEPQKSVKKAEVKSKSIENGAKIVIEYEAAPQVPEVSGETFQIRDVKRKDVTAEEIDQAIHQFCLHHAEWIETPDREVQEGDYVDLTIDANDETQKNICTEVRFEVKENVMAEWMRKLLIGHKQGDVVEGASELEESTENKEDFKPTLCRIKIDKVLTANTPELSDELAKKGGADTVAILKERVEANLNRKADQEVKDRKRQQVEEILLNQHIFDLPLGIIEKKKKSMMESRLMHLTEIGYTSDEIKQQKPQIEMEIQHELTNGYRIFLIAQKVAQDNKIEIFEKEMMEEMMRQYSMPKGLSVINDKASPEETRSRIYVNVLTQKVLDFLVGKAQLIEQ